mgnify:CR=1 FL=1
MKRLSIKVWAGQRPQENNEMEENEKETEEGENEKLSATVLYDMWSKSSDIMSLAERYAMERKKRGLGPVHRHEKNRKKKVVPAPASAIISSLLTFRQLPD